MNWNWSNFKRLLKAVETFQSSQNAIKTHICILAKISILSKVPESVFTFHLPTSLNQALFFKRSSHFLSFQMPW